MILRTWFRRPRAAIRPSTLEGMVSHGRQRQALLDLAKRADRGIFVHLPMWMLIAAGSDLLAQQPQLCAINALIFLANAVARVVLSSRFEALVDHDLRLARRIYMALLLANCVHWGVLTCAAMHLPSLHGAEAPLLFTAVGVGCAGSLGLAISPFVRFWCCTLPSNKAAIAW